MLWPECPIEGRVVDKSLSGRHRWGPVVDHAILFSVDPSQFWNVHLWRLMHDRCNLSKGQRTSLVDGVEAPVTVSRAELEAEVAERYGLTAEEHAAWRELAIFPGASLQWKHNDEYLGLAAPRRNVPAWWPPT